MSSLWWLLDMEAHHFITLVVLGLVRPWRRNIMTWEHHRRIRHKTWCRLFRRMLIWPDPQCFFAKCSYWTFCEEEIVGWDWFINIMPIQYIYIYLALLCITWPRFLDIPQFRRYLQLRCRVSCLVSRPWRIVPKNKDEIRFESEKTTPPLAHTPYLIEFNTDTHQDADPRLLLLGGKWTCLILALFMAVLWQACLALGRCQGRTGTMYHALYRHMQ